MGLPLPHGKLAMWLFLVTEIMFFTALIGTYLLLRNSIAGHPIIRWPTPEDVHLIEYLGAINTLVLVASKTGSRPVHGRSTAGGWSQQRFARRRENQAATALRAAADAAAEVFGRYGADRLDAVVLGGDKRTAAGLRAIRGLRADARLEKYLAKAAERFLTVPDPRLAVLRDIPRAYLATRIRLTEPESDGQPQR